MKKSHSKFFVFLLALAMAVGLLSGTAHAASVEYQEASYDSSTGNVTYTTQTASNATEVNANTTAFANSGWYVVSGEVTISSRITVSGTANLILCDGATLTANKGITVASDNTLNIYAQTNGTGKLVATGEQDAAGIGGGNGQACGSVNIHGGSVTATGDAGAAGIGGGYGHDSNPGGNGGTVTIYGGTVTATGGSYAAGIGGGGADLYSGSGGTVTIYGGTVTATGGQDAAGIGGSDGGNGGTVNIHGGIVTATSGSGMGIGKGSSGSNNGTLTVGSGLVVIGGNDANSATVINNPDSNRSNYMKVGSSAIQYVAYTLSDDMTTVTSAEKTQIVDVIVSTDTTSWDNGGWYVVSGEVTISSLITVSGTANLILADGATLSADAGITLNDGATLNIYAQSGGTGTLVATGGNGAAGIGGIVNSESGTGGTVNIHGGNVTANGGNGSSGGAGGYGINSTVTIYGGTVNAKGGNGGEGDSYGGNGGAGISRAVTIYGGIVTATGGNGGYNAETCGAGGNGISSAVTIYGGTVNATGGTGGGGGMGGGDGGNGIAGNITVNSGSVTATGGNGGSGGDYNGANGKGVTGTITAPSVQESDNGTDWTTLSGSTSTKRYVKAETSSSSVPVEYQEASVDISGNVTFTTKSADTYTLVDATTTSWDNGGWYVVSGEVTISNRITVSGDVNLILADGATLSADAGITLESGDTLNIYAQSGGTGKLTATGGEYAAGIGGGDEGNGGTVNIHGGSVTATGGEGGAGIGGGDEGNGGTVNIHGGSVTATGGEGGAGIGGGDCSIGGGGNGGTVTIYDGSISATGGEYAAGIGGGNFGAGSNVIIYGGSVTATGGQSGAGIGGGNQDAGGNVTIYGGSVTATGGSSAAGIGHGMNKSSNGSLTVGNDCVVLGGDSASSMSIIKKQTSDYTRYQYMKVFEGYTVSFDKNNDSATGSMDIQAVPVSSPDLTLPENSFDLAGYTFNGWNTSSDGTGTGYVAGDKITLTANLTLYAQWTVINYAISYDLNGGTNNSANPSSYTVTSSDITLQAPTKTGYTFVKWTSGDTEITSIPQGSTSGDITLKANWTANTYTIRFNSNGGTGSMSDLVLSYDVSQALSSNQFTRTGYTFSGWKDNNNNTYNGGATVSNLTSTNGAVITLSAQWTLNTYTITYNLDGGTNNSANPSSYTIASSDITLQAPTKTGYTFAKWTSGDTEITSIPQGSTGNRTLTAHWTADTYTITYNLDGGTNNSANPSSYTVASPDITLQAPTKTGYTFAKWTSGDTEITLIPQGSTGNRTLTANWTLATYTISYDLGGGTLDNDNPTSFTYESTDIQINNPTKAGYEFAGWSFDAEISSDLTITQGTAKNLELVAIWNVLVYTISYDLDGGTNSDNNPSSYTVESEDIMLEAPTKAGYEFVNWTSGDTVITVIPQGTTSGDITLTANWSANTYTISYDLDGGTNSDNNPSSYTVESEDITLEAPTKTGYEFVNWTSGDTEITVIPQGTSGDIALTANWTLATYTISYDLDGGTNSDNNPSSYTVESEDITLEAPTKTGYTFVNWTSGDTEITSIPNGTSGDITLTANWTANTYTIQFNGNGGTGSMEDLVLSYDVEGTLSDNKFTRTGYTFSGWKDNDSGTTYNGGATVKNLTAEDGATITLYAQWTQNAEEKTVTTEDINNMTREEKAAVESLSLSGDVGDILNNLQDFTNLNTLNLSNTTNLNSLDLSNLPPSVKSVDLSENSSVTSLKLTNNTNITELKTTNCNNLTSLDIEGCTALVSLDVSYTPINELSAKNCGNLQSINCSWCLIDELIIESCKKLVNLDCSHNHILHFDVDELNLTSLDVLVCNSQDLFNWNAGSVLDMNKFLESPDVKVSGDVEAASVRISDASKVTNLKAYDEDGNEIYVTDNGNGTYNFATVPAKFTYLYNTGYNSQLMDVEVWAADSDSNKTLGGSGGGCNAGLGIFALALLLLKKKF